MFSDPPHQSPAGPSVASLKSDCDAKSGPAQKKGLLIWYQVFIVLRPGDDTLYEFRTDLVKYRFIEISNHLSYSEPEK